VAIFQPAFDGTILAEVGSPIRNGGLENAPKDRGRRTIWGISERWNPAAAIFAYADNVLSKQPGYPGTLVTDPTSQSLIRQFYEQGIWAEIKGAKFPSQRLAEALFDARVNCGPKAVEWLQNALNVLNRNGHDWPDSKVDGFIGLPIAGAPNSGATLRALDACMDKRGDVVLLAMLGARRIEHHVDDAMAHPEQEHFLYGLVDRAKNFMS